MPGPTSTTDGPDVASDGDVAIGATAGAVTPEGVLADLREILTEVIGDDLLLDDLGMDTSFDDDLQLESIEFVALAEQLLERYGEQVDFVGWLAGMELDDIIALTVGRLVDFVVSAA